jgi:hypothetical protein
MTHHEEDRTLEPPAQEQPDGERPEDTAPVHRKPPPHSPEADHEDVAKGIEKLNRILPH